MAWRISIGFALHFARRLINNQDLFNRQQAIYLLSHRINKSSLHLVCHPEETLNWRQSIYWLKDLFQIWRHKPIAYVVGEKNFWKHKFLVNSTVLIPRPETEELVRLAFQKIRKSQKQPSTKSQLMGDEHCNADDNQRNDNKSDANSDNNQNNHNNDLILDIGCGSGCIGLSIKLELPEQLVHLVDKSTAALQIAQTNASRLKVSTEGLFFNRSDLFSTYQSSPSLSQLRFSGILANLPYVTPQELSLCTKSVRKFEPKTAWLCAKPQRFYTRFFKTASKFLKGTGWIILELSPTLVTKAEEWAIPYFAHTQITNDLRNNPRYLLLEKPVQSIQ